MLKIKSAEKRMAEGKKHAHPMKAAKMAHDGKPKDMMMRGKKDCA